MLAMAGFMGFSSILNALPFFDLRVSFVVWLAVVGVTCLTLESILDTQAGRGFKEYLAELLLAAPPAKSKDNRANGHKHNE